MPAVGKSTVGVLLAKRTSRDFVDTDVVIQQGEGRRLRDIIADDGIDAFRATEERYVLALACKATVVATGGSVVYSEPAMKHLAALGTIVFLELPLEELRSRRPDFDAHGLVRRPGQDLAALLAEREPLYRRWADVTVDCRGLGHDAVVDAVCTAMQAAV